jgi:hypothetical protein
MKYPIIKIDGKPIKLTKGQKGVFRANKATIENSITFDNKENELGLTKSDMDLLAWNAAVRLIDIYGRL